MKFNSIRFKISVLYIAILGAILIIYSSILYISLRYTLYNELDYELTIKAKEINNIINSYLDILGNDQKSFSFAVKRAIRLEGDNPDENKIKELEDQWLQKVDRYDLREDYINLLTEEGHSVISSANMDQRLFKNLIKDIKKTSHKEVSFKNIQFTKNNIRILTMPIFYEGHQKYILQVGTSLKPVILILKNRLLYIIISILIILSLAGFSGQIFASRILKPVIEIAKTAENISHENLTARVKAEHIDEEMRYLVNAFNDMISRLEESFNYVFEFSSHVAHELKTPLAIIIGESELALRKKQNINEYKRVIDINLEEAGRMLKTVNNLLLLTRLDYRSDVFKFEKLDLKQLLHDIYKQGEILASPKEIRINLDMPEEQIFVNADELHLRRLFLNLLENALKFTPKNGSIHMNLICEDRKALVSVSDTGIGIAEEDLPEIFNRFFRGDNKGFHEEPGCGLGLSIALRIAKIHNGDIQVKSELGKGSIFTVILPFV